jgi:CRP/FNR family transcriptional regulator
MTSAPPPTLASLLRDTLLEGSAVTRIPRCRRFTVLYSPGSASDSVYYLESGLVKIVKGGDDEKEVLLHLVGPAEIFGEDSVLNGGARTASAEVVSEASIAIIPKDAFLSFCDRQPGGWRLVAEQASRRTRHLEQKLELFIVRDVEYRVLYYLAELAEALGVPQPDGRRALGFSQGEIACLVGATRETTSTTLNALARRGLVELGRRRLLVAEPQLLRAHANNRKRSQPSLGRAAAQV